MKESDQRYANEYLSKVPEYRYLEQSFDNPTLFQLVDPSISAESLSISTGLNKLEIVNLYRQFQVNPQLQTLVQSNYYPRRMMFQLGRSIVNDWSKDPDYAQKILNGEQVMSRVLELHATKGSCDYTCSMCLWSDKDLLTYERQGLQNFGLMKNEEWIRLMSQAYEMGTRTVVFSGGGEPLLKKDIFELMQAAREIGLKTHLYTNGFSLNRLSDRNWQEVLKLDQIRFSIHSPFSETYNRIVELPEKVHALSQVTENIQALLAQRSVNDSLQVGIGFVIQNFNHSEISDMADFCSSIGVDFFNIRQDEVSVSQELTQKQRDLVAQQLIEVRNKFAEAQYGKIRIDLSDDLVALANGVEQKLARTFECHIKHLRPAVSPFGLVGACDLKVEPRFSLPGTVFGNAHLMNAERLHKNIQKIKVPADCQECMPSGRTGNAIFDKLLKDYQAGIDYTQQLFFF